ncbi:MAG: serine/threonine-protein phosphatase, partial [Desulfobacterales bacterium]|nr:serine/threonine-protein phosphatase [Desulfobacterales bacterium]
MANKGSDLDVDLANQVQKVLFPKSSPHCTWGNIGLKNRMAQGVGGDYFDFLPMSDGCQVILLGDVTGHGLHASLIMALLYGYIHRAFSIPCPCRDIVSQLNDFLLSFAARSKEFDQFFSASLFYGIVNPDTRKMTYVNAGHPPPLVRRDGQLFILPATSPPLGFFADPEIAMGKISLEK